MMHKPNAIQVTKATVGTEKRAQDKNSVIAAAPNEIKRR
ncbi:hypothetical protein ABIC74_002438 [Mucilaginibacter rubeus]